MENLSNLPLTQPSLESTVQSFNAYYAEPVELNATAYHAMVSYFTNKNFDQSAAESVSTIIMTQAKKDNYNPMLILDTLKNINSIELSNLVGEILNFNRFKTSNLGSAQNLKINEEIKRNKI